MALVNHAKKEINAKIVYYGPAGSGKNTALTYIYSRVKPSLRGELRTVPAGMDNLMLFDFSPFDIPLPHGYRLRMHVYTLTGVVTNPATWKMTLKGADGIVIMLNPAAGHTAESKESVSQLRDFLSAYGVGLHETPAVLQLNSFINENCAFDATEIAAALDLSGLTACSSNSASGEGLLESLSAISRQVLERVTVIDEKSGTEIAPGNSSASNEPIKIVQRGKSNDHVDIPDAEEIMQLTLLSEKVSSEGRTIRFPLEIKQGEKLRRLVVTVNVELE